MDIEAVRSARLYQQIADQLAGLIVSGKLRPGDRFPAENDLAQRLNVSRPTLREALIALETAGLIEVRNGAGAFVRKRLPVSIRFPWSEPGEAVPGPFEQFQAREIIEVGVAGLAAANATELEIDELEGLLDRMEAQYLRGEGGDEESFAFHVGLARATRNPYLEACVRDLWMHRQGPMWATLRGRLLKQASRRNAVRLRRQIIAALRARDAATACATMATMLANARRLYFEGLDPSGHAEADPDAA